MSELSLNRTPELIATEINIIKDQLNKQFIFSSIEIGKKLVEAKTLVKHGEWGNWLEENVSYSKSTANNLMRIYQEYGSYAITEKSQAIGELGYTQAIALLGIKDPNERENFIENNNVNELSTRELDKAIKELNNVKKEAEKYKNEINNEKEKFLKVQAENEKIQKESNKLLKDLKDKEDEILKVSKEVESCEIKIKELEEKPIEVVGFDEDKIETIKNENKKEIEKLNKEKAKLEDKLKSLENKPLEKQNSNIIKYEVHFEELVKSFENILIDIDNINKDDKAKGDEYSGAIKKLINLMQERL